MDICVCLSANLHTGFDVLMDMSLEKLAGIADAYIRYTDRINEEMKKVGKR